MKNVNKTVLLSGLMAFLVTAATIGVFSLVQNGKTVEVQHVNATPAVGALLTTNEDGEVVPLDFTKIADEVVHAVVHIQSTSDLSKGRNEPDMRNSPHDLPEQFRDFFGPFFRFEDPQEGNPRPRIGTGSGVIINPEGYIITNNHVVENADDLQVTLSDNRTYKASVVGTDPSTDLALIKIQAVGLPSLPMVNSDEVAVGEWVLAVGNPLGLNSTVTAGIVSAKARNINILRERYAVESFIQTDAAINPGNSGGALVNLQGALIGINTAIASPTGTYAGYGFAVPSNIVNKVVEDLIEFGMVQRGVLGVMIRSVDGNLAKQKDLDITRGAYVDSLLANSAAGAAGIRAGDVIIRVDNKTIQSTPELQEAIAGHRPGDEVTVVVNRDGSEKTYQVILNNRSGNQEMASRESRGVLGLLGAEMETLDPEAADELNIDGGVRVNRLYPGKITRNTHMREGFIITQINGKKVKSLKEFTSIIEKTKGGVMLEGVYEDQPGRHYYAFGMDS